MKMYVANCTHQVQDFMYRTVENQKLMKQIIELGGQIQIPCELSTPDIDYIVEQHAKYGFVRIDEIDRTKPFFGLCYSIGTKVDMDKVRRAVVHNQEVLVERGKELRKEAAVAVNNAVEEQVGGLKALEMSVVEEANKDGRDTAVNETIKVDRTAGPAPSRGRSRRAA